MDSTVGVLLLSKQWRECLGLSYIELPWQWGHVIPLHFSFVSQPLSRGNRKRPTQHPIPMPAPLGWPWSRISPRVPGIKAYGPWGRSLFRPESGEPRWLDLVLGLTGQCGQPGWRDRACLTNACCFLSCSFCWNVGLAQDWSLCLFISNCRLLVQRKRWITPAEPICIYRACACLSSESRPVRAQSTCELCCHSAAKQEGECASPVAPLQRDWRGFLAF